MLVREVMTTALTTAGPEEPIYQALAQMVDHNIRHLPIVDAHGLVGLLSDRDLKRAMSAAFGADRGREDNRLLMLRPVKEIMVTEVRTASPDTPLEQVVRTMIAEKLGAMPVIDAKRRPLGIVTGIDLLRLLLERL